MIPAIDFEKRLSFEDHMRLYYYDAVIHQRKPAYADWRLQEDLIHQYNGDQNPQTAQMLTQVLQNSAREIQALRVKWDTEPWEVEKAVIWEDRNKSEYYIQNLMDSHRLEVYADHIFRTQYDVDIGLYYGKSQQYNMGETRAGIEIKCDKMSAKTGNYYFEYQERLHTGQDWVYSGLLKEDNTRYYLYGVVGNIRIFPRDALKEIYEKVVVQGVRVAGCRTAEARRGTSKGFLVSIARARELEVPLRQVAQELGSGFWRS